jgi:hypothetical protein
MAEKGAFKTQLGFGVKNLCLQAEIAYALYLLEWADITALDVGQATKTADGTFSNPAEARHMLNHYNIRYEWHMDANWAFLKRLLDRGGRAISLIHYGMLKEYRAVGFKNFSGAHFVMAVDYDATHVVIHDPLETTSLKRVPIPLFKAAVETVSGGNQYANQAIRLTDLVLEKTMPVSGVCVDPRHPLGRPNPNMLRGFGWARFSYIVSLGRGNTDLAEPHSKYGPYINDLLAIGVTPIIVLTHEFYGEAKYSWGSMNANSWAGLTAGFVGLASQVAMLYAGKGVTYQIWNEGDAASEAAVAIPPDIYGTLFKRVRSAIKAADPTAKVITQGLCSGTVTGVNYYKATGIGDAQDGIAFHPYLAKAAGYGSSPSFSEQIKAWSVLPGDLYITEYGQPGNYNARDEDLAAYATAALVSATNRVKAMCWFAYADGQHTSVGILKTNGLYREELRSALLAEDRPAEAPPALPAGRYRLAHPSPEGLVNIRDKAGLDGKVLGTTAHDAIVDVLGSAGYFDGTYLWQAVKSNGVTGLMAVIGGTWELQPYEDDGTEEIVAELDKIIEWATALKNRLLQRAG